MSRHAKPPARRGCARLDPALVREVVGAVFTDLSGWDRLHDKSTDARHGALRDTVEQAFLQQWISYCARVNPQPSTTALEHTLR